jgi:hypothetical protein
VLLLLLVVRRVVVIDFIAGVVLRTVLLSDLLFLLLLLFSIMATAFAVLIVVSRVEFLGRSKHQACGIWNLCENLGLSFVSSEQRSHGRSFISGQRSRGRSFISGQRSRGRSFICWKHFGRDADVTGSDRADPFSDGPAKKALGRVGGKVPLYCLL